MTPERLAEIRARCDTWLQGGASQQDCEEAAYALAPDLLAEVERLRELLRRAVPLVEQSCWAGEASVTRDREAWMLDAQIAGIDTSEGRGS